MRFSVSHETVYGYSEPVRLAAHLLRLTPRPESGTLLSRDLLVEPRPAFIQETVDGCGNLVTRLDFDGSTDRLRIVSAFELETRGEPPFQAEDADAALAAYLPDAPAHPSVRAFAQALAAESGGDMRLFLTRLTRALYERTDRRIRHEGYAQTPEATLATAVGACRDLTVLFMAACRCLGAPARFVSGYQANAESVDGQRHLHAWPEAWLPGLGWRGFDPTHGLPVTDGHVALSAAPEQGATMPVEGGFYGGAVTSTLDYSVRISTGA